MDILEAAARRELAIERLQQGKTIPQMEALLQLPGGGEKCVIVAGQPIEIGEIRCMLFTFADIEARRKAELALKQSEERFELTFRLSPVPTMLALREGFRVLMINDAFTRDTGYASTDIVGRDIADLPLWHKEAEGLELERLLAKSGRAHNVDLVVRSGTASAAIDIGLGLGPIVLGLVAGQFGMPWAIGVGAAIAATGALWTLTLQQRTTVSMPRTH